MVVFLKNFTPKKGKSNGNGNEVEKERKKTKQNKIKTQIIAETNT